MNPVTWGVLSVSKHYALRVHPALREGGFAHVLALASRSGEKAREAAERLGIPRAYGSYEDMLRDPDIEAVYLPLPNHLHAPWIRKAADAGKHVLCEKPFTMNAQEAADAASHARERGVLLMEAFMYRFHPQWRRVKEIIVNGEIGGIRAISFQQFYSNRDPRNIRNRTETGGGALYDIGSYAVSVSRFLMGAEPKRVVALVSRDPDFGTDTLSSGILDFGRARALFTVGTADWPGQRVEVRGTEGEIVLDLPVNMFADVPARVEVKTRIASRVLSLGPADQYGLMFRAFGEAVRAGKPAPTPPEDGVANMRALDALFASETSGGWVEVG